MRPILLWLLLPLAGCVVSEDHAADVEADTTEAALISTTARPTNPIDDPREGLGVARLEDAQLHRLPVSWFARDVITLSGAHHLTVRTDCAATAPERRDSGLYVVERKSSPLAGVEVVDARFNDDCTGTACECTTCSKVDMGASTGTSQYEIFTFSMQRTKAHCAIEYATSENGSFVRLGDGSARDVGGALVDVGAVERLDDEWIEARTEVDDAWDDVQMLLFDVGTSGQPSSTSTYASTYWPVFAVDTAGDDARVGPQIPAKMVTLSNCDGTCGTPQPRHYALIGLEAPPTTTPTIDRVETTATLLRGPADEVQMASIGFAPTGSATWTCGTPRTLEPGRHAVEIDARTSEPYADNDVHDFDACELLGFSCPSGFYQRGVGNYRALEWRVQTSTTDGLWKTVAQRALGTGAFGCDNDCFDTFAEDVDLTTTTSVRPCVRYRDGHVQVSSTWRAAKNPLASELKVATFNVHHGKQFVGDSDGIENDAEGRNLANLLAARGRFSTGAASVVESADQAPFEWNADVIALQELSWVGTINSFQDEANDDSSLRWHYVYGRGKENGPYESKNAVITHEDLVAGTSLEPPDVEACSAIQDTDPNADGHMYCQLDHDDWEADLENGAVPAKLSVRRHGQGDGDVPIMTYSLILEPQKYVTDDDYSDRREELEALIEAIRQHLAANAGMFNRDGDPASQAENTRIILAGDFNFFPHHRGENHFFVERLRQEFGYAVDVAAAAPGSWENFYDMHAWRGSEPPSDRDLPEAFTDEDVWIALTDATKWWWGSGQSWPHLFPYWAATYHGSNSDYGGSSTKERHDAILLVGRGWAKDDAVRSYLVMHTHAQGDSPFAFRRNGSLAAVDIAPYPGDHDVPNGGVHYRPTHDLTDDSVDGCTTAGCAAVESDHIPVGVRLRISR
jgi:hypothetical protein